MTDFKPMLAKDGNPRELSYPQFLQVKLDGIRAVVKDGQVLSRSLKPIPNKEIQAALGRPEFEGLDGELVVGDPAAPDCMQRTTSFVMAPNKTGEPWTYHVFDLHALPHVPYVERLLNLRRQVLASLVTVPSSENRLWCVDTIHCSTPEDVEDHEERLLAEGHEGVILRDPAGFYKFGRSGKKGPLIKVKRYIDFEAEVIGVFELMHNGNEAVTNALGRTERSTAKAGLVGKGVLGGFELRALNGPHAGQEFRCGTGFDALTREQLWGDPEAPVLTQQAQRRSLVGRIAKIKSFPVGVKDAPRFPVFLGWRDERDMS